MSEEFPTFTPPDAFPQTVGTSANASASGGPPGEEDPTVQPLPLAQRAPVVTRKVESRGKNAFVSGLHKEVTDADLAKIFGEFGAIQQTYILTDVNTGRSRGIGFVHFDDPQCVLNAIAALDGKQVTHTGKPEDTTTINVRVAFDDALFSPEETNKLFIRNVPPGVRTSQLAQYFAQFGKVLECSIHKDISAKGRSENTNLHMAYVTFQTIADANKALQAVHKTQPFDDSPDAKPLQIKRAESLQCRNIRLRKSGQLPPAPPGAPAASGPSAMYGVPTHPHLQQHQQHQQQRMSLSGSGMNLADSSVTSNSSWGGSSAFGPSVGSIYGGASSGGSLQPNMYPQVPIPMMQPAMYAPNGGAGGAFITAGAPAGGVAGQAPQYVMLPPQAPGGPPMFLAPQMPGAPPGVVYLMPQGHAMMAPQAAMLMPQGQHMPPPPSLPSQGHAPQHTFLPPPPGAGGMPASVQPPGSAQQNVGYVRLP